MTEASDHRGDPPPVWVLVADEGRACILEYGGPGRELAEVEELTYAAAHAANADLRRDAYGRRAGSGTKAASSTTESAGADKLDHEAELFARRIADRLAQARVQQRFSQLRIAAAPRFLGHLRKQLNDEVKSTVVHELDKDLLQLDRRALAQRLFPGAGR
jgi:protein required for attachment to host cells